MEAGYATNDVKGAERVLLSYLETLANDESNKVRGIDYDMARAIAHERLFLIYRKTQRTNEMEAEFQKSLECLTRFAARSGSPAPSVSSYEAFASNIEKAERGQYVKWKHE